MNENEATMTDTAILSAHPVEPAMRATILDELRRIEATHHVHPVRLRIRQPGLGLRLA